MTPSTTIRTACALAVLAATGGCASLTTPSAAGSVALGPRGHAEARLVVPGGADTTVRLANAGPGRADFVVRMGNGVDLQSGALDTATVRFTAAARVVILVALDATADGPTTVAWSVDGAGGAAFEWDLARAGR